MTQPNRIVNVKHLCEEKCRLTTPNVDFEDLQRILFKKK